MTDGQYQRIGAFFVAEWGGDPVKVGLVKSVGLTLFFLQNI